MDVEVKNVQMQLEREKTEILNKYQQESEDGRDVDLRATGLAAAADSSSSSDYDEVDAKPEGQLGPLRFKKLTVSSENKGRLSAALNKNSTLEWMSLPATELTDAAVDSLCQFLEKNTTLKTLLFDTAAFTASEFSSILLALSKNPAMIEINIMEQVGDECVTKLCNYIGHSLPVIIRSVTPPPGRTSCIEMSGRNGRAQTFFYMTTVNGIKTFKKCT